MATVTKRLIDGQFPVQRLFPYFRVLANCDRLVALWALSRRPSLGMRELLGALQMDPQHDGIDLQAIRRYMSELEILGLVDIDRRPNNANEYSFNRQQMERVVTAIIKFFGLFPKAK
jgi:hypothetical protein